jgi:transposase-like protein
MLETNQTIIKHKLGLLNLAEELSNVSKACKVMGLSRDTFYRYKAAVDNGRRPLVRHGTLSEREVETGIGAVKVNVPRVRDRGDGNKTRFQSSILPKYVRRMKSLEALIPWLYLKGVSTGNFQDALSALLGLDPVNPL